MINFVDSGNNKNTKGRRKRRFKCGKCLGTLTCMSSVLICCILLTVRNMYKLGNGVSWFDRKLSGKSNKLRFREKLIDHYLLVPLLLDHYSDGNLGNLLFQLKSLNISNQNLHVVVYISGISSAKCSSVRLEFEGMLDFLYCNSTRQYKGIVINNAVNNIFGSNVLHSDDLLTIMDADDLFTDCTLWQIVDLYKRNPTRLLFHSFLTKQANKVGGTKCVLPVLTYDGVELYSRVYVKRTPWLVSSGHHGHHTTELSVFLDVSYGEGKRSQDSRFVRDVINFYGNKSSTAQYSSNIYTVYRGASELWRKTHRAVVPRNLAESFLDMKFPDVSDVVINLGSNVQPISPNKNGLALIFEPISHKQATINAKKKAIAAGGMSLVIPAAVSNIPGYSNMTIYNNNGLSSSLSKAATDAHWNSNKKRDGKVVTVRVYTLDEILDWIPNKIPIKYLKTDIQGYDFLVVSKTNSEKFNRIESLMTEAYMVESSYKGVRNNVCDDWVPYMKKIGWKMKSIVNQCSYKTFYSDEICNSMEQWGEPCEADVVWEKLGEVKWLTHTWMGNLGNEIWQYMSLLGISSVVNRKLCVHNVTGLGDAGKLFGYHYGPMYLKSVFTGVYEFPRCPLDVVLSGSYWEDKRRFTKGLFSNVKGSLVFIGGYLQHNSYVMTNVFSKLGIRSDVLSKAKKEILSKCVGGKWVGLHYRVYPSSHGEDRLLFSDYLGILSRFVDKGFCLYVSGNNLSAVPDLGGFEDVIVSTNGFALDFAVLTLVDNLIISTGTFAYFAGVYNKDANASHDVYYYEGAKLLFGFSPVRVEVSWISWSKTMRRPLKLWHEIADGVVFVSSHVVGSFVSFLVKAKSKKILKSLRCRTVDSVNTLSGSNVVQIVSLTDTSVKKNHFDIYRLDCPVKSTIGLIGPLGYTTIDKTNSSQRSQRSVEAKLERVVCMAPLFYKESSSSKKFLRYLKDALLYYKDIGFTKIVIYGFELPELVMKMLSNNELIDFHDYGLNATNNVNSGEVVNTFGRGRSGLMYERGKLFAWNSCYLDNYDKSTFMLFVDYDEVLWFKHSVLSEFEDWLTDLDDYNVFMLQSSTMVGFNDKSLPPDNISSLRYYGTMESTSLLPYNAGRYHSGRWKYLVKGFGLNGPLLNDLMWTHSVGGLNYSYSDANHYVCPKSVCGIRHYQTNFLFDGQISKERTLSHINNGINLYEKRLVVYVLTLENSDADRLLKFRSTFSSVFEVRVCYGVLDSKDYGTGYGNTKGHISCLKQALDDKLDQDIIYIFEDDAVALFSLKETMFKLPKTVSDVPLDALVVLLGGHNFVDVSGADSLGLRKVNSYSFGSYAWCTLKSNIEILMSGFEKDLKLENGFKVNNGIKMIGADTSFYVNANRCSMSVYVLDPLLFGHPENFSKTKFKRQKGLLNKNVVDLKGDTYLNHLNTPYPYLNVQLKERSLGRLFLCGYNVSYLSFLYPKRSVFGSFKKSLTSTINDVMIYGYRGPTCESKYFKGKIIYINGEPDVPKVLPSDSYIFAGVGGVQLYYVSATLQRLKDGHALVKKSAASISKNVMGSKFMSYMSSNCVSIREKAFNDISKYVKPVSVLGNCKGVVNMNVQKSFNWVDNINVTGYRFSLSMDKIKRSGYVSEKILMAFLSGSIPIYYGTTEVFNIFNKKAFIYYDVESPKVALDKIKYLESNKSAYMEMFNEPMLAVGAYDKYFSKDSIRTNLLGSLGSCNLKGVGGKNWGLFKNMIGIFNELDVPYSLSWGTLLFWYRSCSFDSSDMDFSIDMDWFKNKTNHLLLHDMLVKNGWRKEATYGIFGVIGYEEAWIRDGMKMDLFSLSYVNGSYVCGLTLLDGNMYSCFVKRKGMSMYKWGDLMIRAPSNVESVLDFGYGKDWRIPDPNYQWDVTPFKRGVCSKDYVLQRDARN